MDRKNLKKGIFALLLAVPATLGAVNFNVTNNAVENAGNTPGDLAAAINSANAGQNNGIVFQINNQTVNYNAGAMPDLRNLPMTINGNNQNGLILQTTAASLFNASGVLNPGVLTLNNMLSGGPILQAPLVVGAGSTINFTQGAGAFSYAGTISGNGGVSYNGAIGTTYTITGASTYSGSTTVDTLTLVLGNSNALGSGAVTLSANTILRANGAAVTLANNYTLNGDATFSGTNGFSLNGNGNLNGDTLTVANTANQIVLGGQLSGVGSSISHNGAGGQLLLSGNNTFNGGVTSTAGTLIVGHNNALGTGALTLDGGSLHSNSSLIAIANNYSLNNDSFLGGQNSLLMNGNGQLGGQTLTVNNTAGTITLGGVISGNGNINSKILQNGAGGSLLLSGANTFQGGVTVTAGTLIVGHNNALGSGAFVLNGGSLRSSGAFTVANNYSLAANSFMGGTNNLTLNGTGDLNNHALTVNNTAGTITLGGVISDTGSITQNGVGGTLLLSGNNTFSGGVTVTAGTLILGHVNALGTGAFVLNGGALQANAPLVLAKNYSLTGNSSIGGNNNLTLNGTGNLNGNTLTLNNSVGTTITIGGVLSGAGGVTYQGNGTGHFSVVNTYTGPTQVSSGTLRMGIANAIATSSGLNVANGAIFNLNNFNQTVGDLSGAGSITLGTGNLTFGTNNGVAQTFSGIVSGGAGAGIIKQGTGIAILSGINTYTGPTQVNVGTLRMGVANAIANSSGLNIAGGATFDLNNFNQTIGDLSGAGGITLGTGNLTFGTNNGIAQTFSGVIGGSGGLIKQGTGIVILSGVNAYIGPTQVSAGTLRTGAANVISQTNTLTVAGGATFDLNNFNQTIGDLSGAGSITLGTGNLTFGTNSGIAQTFSGVISGGGSLIKQGTGIAILSGVNTYTGPTQINVGTLRMGVANAIANSSGLNIAGGATFDLNNFNQTVADLTGSGNINLGTATFTFGTNNALQQVFLGNITGNGTVIKQGTGTVVFSGSNNYAGGTIVNAGILQGNASGLRGNITNNATVIFDQIGTGTYASVITGTGNFVKQNTGTLILSNASNYTGTTLVNSGILRLGVANAVPQASALTVAGGAVFDLNNFNQTIGDLNGAGSITLGTGNLTFGSNNLVAQTFSGIISGTGSIIKQGTGSAILTGVNTYTGSTQVNAGTLRVGVANAISTNSSLTVAGGATFDLNNFNQTVGDLNGAGNIALGTGNLTFGSNNLVAQTFSGIINGAGSIIKQGAGSAILTGANAYTGSTQVNAGTLRVGAANAIPNNNLNVAGGATFDLNNFNQTVGDLNGAGNITLGTGNLTFGTNNLVAQTFFGVISGTGSIIKQGTGSAILTGVNTYTGSTQVNAGTLRVGVANAISTNSSLTVAIGATFDLNNFNQTVGDLNGAGNIALGTGNLTFGSNNPLAQTFTGIVNGVGSIIKQGTGSAILTGANTYTGSTQVNAGTLRVGAANAIPNNSNLTIAGGATFDLNNFNQTVGDLNGAGNITLGTGNLTFGTNNLMAQTFSGEISGTAGVTKQGTGTAIFSGKNTYSGGTTVAAGILQGNAAGLQGNITNNATVIFDQIGSGIYSDVISGGGNLIKQNSGSLTLTRAQTFTGGIAVNGGTLILASGGALSTPVSINQSGSLSLSSGGTLNSPVTVNFGGNFIFDGGTLNNTLSNAGTVIVNSPNIVSGDYIQTGNLMLGMVDKETYGQLVATGNITLSGGLTINLLNELGTSLQDGDTFTVVKTTGGTITYNTLTITQTGYSNALLKFLVENPTPQLIQLKASRTEIFNTLPPDEMAYLEGVATVIEDLRSTRPEAGSPQETLLSAIDQAALQGIDTLIKELAQLTPNQLANGATLRDVPIVVQSNNVQPIANRLDALRSGVNTLPMAIVHGPSEGYAAGDDTRELGNYVSVGPLLFSGVGKQGVVNAFPAYHFNTKGFGMFGDLNIGQEDAIVGVAFSHNHSTVKNDNGTSIVQMQSPQGALYGNINYGSKDLDGIVYLEGIFSYGRTLNRSRRYVNFLSEVATAKYWSNQMLGRAQLGFTPYAEIFEVSPFLLWQGSLVKLDAFKESGAPISNLQVSSNKVDTVSAGAGLKISYVQYKTTWLPEFHLKFLRDFKVTKFNVISQFLLGGPVFSTFVPPAQKNSFNTGFSITAGLTENFDMTAGYDFDLKGKFSSHSGAIRLRWKF